MSSRKQSEMELLLQNKDLQIENLQLQLEINALKAERSEWKSYWSEGSARENDKHKPSVDQIIEAVDMEGRSPSPGKVVRPKTRSSSSKQIEQHLPRSATPTKALLTARTPKTRSALPRWKTRNKSKKITAKVRIEDSNTERAKTARLCSEAGCHSQAKRLGMCIKHGGGRPCSVEGCTNKSRLKGLCWSHGGKESCKAEGCNKSPKSGGYCCSHKR